jgi:hypothetical protein
MCRFAVKVPDSRTGFPELPRIATFDWLDQFLKTSRENGIALRRRGNHQQHTVLAQLSAKGLQNTRTTRTKVTSLNGKMVQASLMGDLGLCLDDKNVIITLHDILVCLDFKQNV